MIVYINPDDPLMNDGNGKIKIFKENKLAIVFCYLSIAFQITSA